MNIFGYPLLELLIPFRKNPSLETALPRSGFKGAFHSMHGSNRRIGAGT
jgi:hypothetical protein